MHYRSLNAVLEQYHHPSSPNSLALHIDRQTQGYLKLHTPDGIPTLQAFNQHHLGILRNDTGLCCAIAQLRLGKQNQAEPHTTSEYENRNLLECSLAVAQAAYRRRQNIGAYFNSDC